MIKNFAKKALQVFGLQITRIPKQSLPPQPPTNLTHQTTKQLNYLPALTREPLNADLHLQYAIGASRAGKPYLAYAELKTAEYLGADRKEIEKYAVPFRQALPDLKSMNHNQYYRFSCLSSEITERAGQAEPVILDVGGGEGQLAAFLPRVSYCLAEPRINGISGTNLPFADYSFDYVVSCHVLEHIPLSQRKTFLDQLLSKARHGVILLNPFYIEKTLVEERLNLILEITGAEWAREHLECTLPEVQDIQEYAVNKNLQLSIKPNGTMTTSLAFVFLDYFATKASRPDEWEKINRFFNEKYIDILSSPDYPNAYLIYLGWPEERAISAS